LAEQALHDDLDHALSKRETSDRVNLSTATIMRRAKSEDTFPKPVDLGGNRIAFVEDEVLTYWHNTSQTYLKFSD
jgi:predicted DNA-binding transcriptional regulator AlpA